MVLWWVIGLGTVTVGGVGYWAWRKYKEHQAEYGTSDEKELTDKEGADKVEEEIKRRERELEKEGEKAKKIEQRIKKDEAVETRERAPRSEIDADKAAVKGAKTFEGEIKLKEITAAIEGRVVGLQASFNALFQSIYDYISTEKSNSQAINDDFRSINVDEKELYNELRRWEPYRNKEREMELVNKIKSKIRQVNSSLMGHEEREKNHKQELIDQLKEILKESKGIIEAFKILLKDFWKTEVHERGSFHAELGSVSTAIFELEHGLKSAEIPTEERREKLKFLNHSLISVNILWKEFDRIHGMMRHVWVQMELTLKNLCSMEDHINKRERFLIWFEQELEGNYDGLSKFISQKLEDAPRAYNIFDEVRKYTLNISEENENFYKQLLLVIRTIHEVGHFTNIFEQLALQLNKGEGLIDKYIAEAAKVVESIVSGHDQEDNMERLISDLRDKGTTYASSTASFIDRENDRLDRSDKTIIIAINELLRTESLNNPVSLV